jgi:hypothetical protein
MFRVEMKETGMVESGAKEFGKTSLKGYASKYAFQVIISG